MKVFNQYKAVENLKKLALSPFDLTIPDHLNAERIESFILKACGLTLLYGTERITKNVIEELKALAKESKALSQMHAMQAGETINAIHGFPSENRAVLHTATRDFFEHAHSSTEAELAAQLAFQEVKKLERFIEEINKENHWKDLVLIGIGGSELGPRAHYQALQALKISGRNVHFIGNIDPDDAILTLRSIELSHTLFLVVSKTGTTLETVTNETFIRDKLQKAGLNPYEHFISVSMPESPLDNPSKYRWRFFIWDWIGGRYSTTSMVGGVMFAYAFGFDVYWEFLKGANAMDKCALQDEEHNLPLLYALLGIWNRNFLEIPTVAMIPYSQALSRYSAHIQQLDMESNGKRIDRYGQEVHFKTGPIIWGEPGTNAQHSFFQLLHQGKDIVSLEMVGFLHSQTQEDLEIKGTTSQQKLLANLFAQAIALATGKHDSNPNKTFLGNRPTRILMGNQLTPFILGALLALYEHKVAFQGFIWGINSFDQEGVQLGKDVASKILQLFKQQNLNETLESYPLGKAFLKVSEAGKDIKS